MKPTFRFLSVLLCLLLLFSCFVPAAAVREEEIVYTITPPPPNKTIAVPSGVDLSLNWDGMRDALETLFYTDATEVDVSSLRIPATKAHETYLLNLTTYSPSLFRMRPISYTTKTVGGVSVYFHLTYTIDSSENLAKRRACESVLRGLLYGIQGNDALSDYEKCLLLHDRLVAWVAYDYENYLNNTIPNDSYSAYGPLISRIGVCNGYALVYGWLLDELGIENYYTLSNTINHGWNKVILDGEPYYADATYDDPVWDVPGRVHHEHFMVSYPTFAASHEASDFDSSPVSQQYETWFDKNSDSQIVLVGNKLYYIQSEYGNRTAALKQRDLSGQETVLKEIDSYYRYASGSHTYTSYPFYPKLIAIGNDLIYTAPREVRAFNVATNEDRLLFTPDASIYESKEFCNIGLRQIDGTIYVTANSSPGFDADTEANYTDSFPYCTHETMATLYEEPGADCTTPGLLEQICTACHMVTQTELPGEHTSLRNVSAQDATCTAPGFTAGVYCDSCEQYVSGHAQTAVNPDNHTGMRNVPAQDATCTAPGFTAGVYCDTCKQYVSGHAQTAVDPANHTGSYVSKQAKDATCTAAGWTEEISCPDCEAVLTASVSVPPTPHQYQAESTVDPTCTAEGYTLYVCKDCGAEKQDDFTDALNHPGKRSVPAQAATCTQKGFTAGVYCDTCKKYISGHKKTAIDPDNHTGSYVSKQAQAPTCTKKGRTEEISCPDCQAVLTAGKAIAKLGHTDPDAEGKCTRCRTQLVDVPPQPQPEDEGLCKYCGKSHTGFFGAITKFFHSILYFFKNLF